MREMQRHLSRALKRIRKQKGWSLDVTSRKTGVSKAMLGQIERGESSPTVATLWKIAVGFQTSFSSFLEPVPIEYSASLIRTESDMGHQPVKDDLEVSLIFPYDPTFGFEVYKLTLHPGYEHMSDPHGPGVTEHLIVLTGKIDMYVNDEWARLSEGEAIRFAADQPHGYRNPIGQSVTCHNLIHYPVNDD